MLRNFPLVISRAVNKKKHTLIQPRISLSAVKRIKLTAGKLLLKKRNLRQHFNGAWNAQELFINAKHVFNICSVTLGGNLYHGGKHKWKCSNQRVLLDWGLSVVKEKYWDACTQQSVKFTHITGNRRESSALDNETHIETYLWSHFYLELNASPLAVCGYFANHFWSCFWWYCYRGMQRNMDHIINESAPSW